MPRYLLQLMDPVDGWAFHVREFDAADWWEAEAVGRAMVRITELPETDEETDGEEIEDHPEADDDNHQ